MRFTVDSRHPPVEGRVCTVRGKQIAGEWEAVLFNQACDPVVRDGIAYPYCITVDGKEVYSTTVWRDAKDRFVEVLGTLMEDV